MASTKTGLKASSKAGSKVKPDKEQNPHDMAVRGQAMVDEGWYMISLGFYRCHHNEFYKTLSFSNFRSYIESRFPNIDYRIAMYYVQIGQAIETLNLTFEQVKDIDWSKFKEVSTLMTKETTDEELRQYLKAAKEMTFAKVKDFVKETKMKQVGSGERSLKVKMMFSFSDEQAKLVNEGLREAMKRADTDNEAIAFEYVMTEWLLNHSSDKEFQKRMRNSLSKPVVEKRAPQKERSDVTRDKAKGKVPAKAKTAVPKAATSKKKAAAKKKAQAKKKGGKK